MRETTQESKTQVPIASMDEFCDEMARSPVLTMDHIWKASQKWVGDGLLTVNANLSRPGEQTGEIYLQRIWTSNSEAYPVGGKKRKTMTPWTEQLLIRNEIYKSEGAVAMSEAFDDYAVMAGLGLRRALNIPITHDGRCVGTFNAMGQTDSWEPYQVAWLRLLALLAKPWILQVTTAMSEGDAERLTSARQA